MRPFSDHSFISLMLNDLQGYRIFETRTHLPLARDRYSLALRRLPNRNTPDALPQCAAAPVATRKVPNRRCRERKERGEQCGEAGPKPESRPSVRQKAGWGKACFFGFFITGAKAAQSMLCTANRVEANGWQALKGRVFKIRIKICSVCAVFAPAGGAEKRNTRINVPLS